VKGKIMEKKKTIPETSMDTRLLVQKMEKTEMGEVVEYNDLSNHIGRNVQDKARYVLESARRILVREHRMVFAAVRNVGLRRMDDSQLAAIGVDARKRINRASKRAISKITCVRNFEELSNSDKVQHNTSLSLLGMVTFCTTHHAARRLENKVRGSGNALPTALALEIMK